MLTIKNKWIPFGKESNAMTVWPLLFVRSDRMKYFTERVKRHEQIHAHQQKELLAVGIAIALMLLPVGCGWWSLLALPLFYWLYGLFYVIGWVRWRNNKEAYTSIPFEQEAYVHQDDENYLDNREPFAWREFV